MNLLDVLIIFGVVLSLIRGQQVGFVRQFFSTLGFFVGLFVGAFLQPYTVQLVNDDLAKVIMTITTTLGLALVSMTAGEYLGLRIKRHISSTSHYDRADKAFGSVLAAVSLLILVWLGATIAGSFRSPELQKEINESKIVGFLSDHMPAAPSVIDGISSLIDPNGFPQVFTGREPIPQDVEVTPSLEGFEAAIAKTKNSVVKIVGQGCGGIVDGSGFVVGDNLVATNAHVVAGIRRPYVQDNNGTHISRAIWFDPNLDLAVLRTNNLDGEPLAFNTDVQPRGSRAVVIGYPGGGDFDVEAAVILDRFTAVGRNIYGENRTSRDVYEIDADIVPGNSGGPVISVDGDVIGIVFAQSTTYDHVGYALTAKKVVAEIQTAMNRNQEVSTSYCAE